MGKLCKQKTQPAEHETDAPTIDQQQQQQHQQQQHEAALEVAFSSKNSVKTKEKKNPVNLGYVPISGNPWELGKTR